LFGGNLKFDVLLEYIAAAHRDPGCPRLRREGQADDREPAFVNFEDEHTVSVKGHNRRVCCVCIHWQHQDAAGHDTRLRQLRGGTGALPAPNEGKRCDGAG
jgi:hypothetical protein